MCNVNALTKIGLWRLNEQEKMGQKEDKCKPLTYDSKDMYEPTFARIC